MIDQFDMFDGEGAFLGKMRHHWNKAIEGEGAFCPCCGKWGKVYKTKISQHLALCLRWISMHGDADGWVDVQNTEGFTALHFASFHGSYRLIQSLVETANADITLANK